MGSIDRALLRDRFPLNNVNFNLLIALRLGFNVAYIIASNGTALGVIGVKVKITVT